MELSPMPDYHNGEPWWIVVDSKGKEPLMALPKSSALDELYINDKWYGLLPDHSLLDPAGIVKKRLDNEPIPISVYENYKRTMGIIVARQKSLQGNYHPNTYALYGDGALKPNPSGNSQESAKLELETSLPDDKLQTWGKVVWEGDFPAGTTEADLMAAQQIGDDRHGVLTLIVRGQTVKLTVQQKANAPKEGQPDNGIVPGDGTVPAWSAEAQGRGLVPGVPGDKATGMQMAFVQGGFEHQFCFDHPWTRWATLYSFAQIARSIGVPTS
jgi:hypothetical protein